MTAGVRYDVEGGVATVALDRPEQRNALSTAMLDDLLAAFTAARDDDAVRCVVVRSTHPRTFSAGGDLEGFAADAPLVDKHREIERFPRLFELIGALGKPSICAVNGHCLAGALGLVLACDLVVAGDTATFGTPEITVGLFPFMVMALLARNVGRKKASELVLLGARIDAAEAERVGIVNKVVPPDELDGAVAEWAAQLAGRSPLALRLGKDAMHRQQDMGLTDALAYLQHTLTLALSTEDLREGIDAFFAHREPRWTGQ
jgi:enoyl-CoA hydratase/carnithine racemase